MRSHDTVAAARGPVFRRYLLSRALIGAGNALTLVALPILVYRLTSSATLTALVAAVQTAPYLVFGLPAGALVDRWHRRRVLALTSAASSVTMASVPVAYWLVGVSFVHVLLVAVVVSTLFVFADAAAFGVLPSMVGRDGVASATSALVSVGTTISLVGPLLSGVLVTVLDPAVVLGFDALGYLAAALIMWRLRWPGSELPDQSQAGGESSPDLVAEIREGLGYLWDMPVVRWLTVLGIGASLSGGAVSALLVVIGVEQLGLASTAPEISWLFVAGSLGSLVAAAVLPVIQHRVGVGLITTTGYAAAFSAMVALSFAHTVILALGLLFVFNAALTLLIVNGIVTRQVLTPDRLQARVNTTARLIAWGGNPLGAMLGGLIAGLGGTSWALRGASLGLLASLVGAAVAGVTRFPRLREFSAHDETSQD